MISGAGLEDFLDSILDDSDIIDSSEGIALLHMEEEHDHGHEDHHHEDDPHILAFPGKRQGDGRKHLRGALPEVSRICGHIFR